MISRGSSFALIGSAIGLAIASTALASVAQAQTGQSTAHSTVKSSIEANSTIERTEGGHRLGNPEAEIKLIEFVSYTCSHCANFTREGEPALKLAYIGSGKVSLEIRHIVRDVVDITAALATNCGDPQKFPKNHAILMGAQADWLGKAQNATDGQMQRWRTGGFGDRSRAIANDIGIYALMEQQGYSRAELDRCLTDEERAKELIAYTEEDANNYSIPGTPSFVLNGELLEGVHSWSDLQPKLDAAVLPHLGGAS